MGDQPGISARSGQAPTTAPGQGKHRQPDPFPTAAGPSVYPGGEAGGAGAPRRADSRFPIPSCRPLPWSLRFPGRMALVLGAVLLAAGAAVPPALPAPRDLARSVLETHGQELRLLKMLGVARTVGAGRATGGVQLRHPSRWDPFPHRHWEATKVLVLPADIRLGHPFQHQLHRPAARLPQKPARPPRGRLPSPAGQGKSGTGSPRHMEGDRKVPPRCSGSVCPQVQRCTAQVSVFAFLPDVPLSMVECGKEPVRAPCPKSFGGGSGGDVSPPLWEHVLAAE